jgi:hypothetical protein
MFHALCVRALFSFALAVLFTATLWAAPQTPQPVRQLEMSGGARLQAQENWKAVEERPANAMELIAREPLGGGEFRQSHVLVTTENRTDFEDASKRLADIAAEVPSSPPRFLTISGWPALQRRYTALLERRGQESPEKTEMQPKLEREAPATQRVTTAIAAGNQLIRVEAALAPGADPNLADQAEMMGRSVKVAPPSASERAKVQQALQKLRKMAAAPKKTPPKAAPKALRKTEERDSDTEKAEESVESAAPSTAAAGAGVLVPGQAGELDVAVSTNGQNVVVATNNGFSFSSNAGQTFLTGGPTPGNFPRDGDPSLAVGASGNFYYGFIGFPNGTPAANNVTGCSTGIAVSTNNGQSFAFRNHAVVCVNGQNTCFPDQEHIAADRVNAGPNGDQVYSVWRNFTPPQAGPGTSCNFGSGFVAPRIVCSADGGQNWSQSVSLGTGDFPRVTVGRDGSVYAVFRQNANVMMDKFSSCASGLSRQTGFPVTVATVADVACPVPGLDRCNDGNTLSSHMAAVNENSANHVFVAFANRNGSGEDIVVRDSIDGGRTFPRQVNVNSAVTARRFLPWVCAATNTAFVSWYDRRSASKVVGNNQACLARCQVEFDDCIESGIPRRFCFQRRIACRSRCVVRSRNDLTEYFFASARPVGGALQAQAEINLSGNPDPQCASGFPCGARSANDFGSCPQPQAGSVGGGCPKYGDYNGNACVAGRAYFAWASATSPVGAPAGSGIRVFFAASPPPATLTIRKVLSPSGDNGKFNLRLDGVSRAAGVGSQGSTGPLTVLPGVHFVDESAAANTSILNYDTTFGGDCAGGGSILLNPGDNKTCTITNKRRPLADCLADCRADLDDCMSAVGEPGGPLASQCVSRAARCTRACRQ